ncbi:unnamed protein product [Fusarium graminearum]|uniref:Inhibitor I9 domain-containing protein n=1 Tax=Gibberella zeae TaxID=5518 RepID=A0A2H3GWF6_GIBZA|nr:hypothetical protein FG05_02957 [Fusarium graminearum]KAI6771639.1 hypothetical protein HG531_009264 [Fusarium graminearum]PCD34476.1 hypothetical protein FGRA07_08794 [Fusarium graminearum]CAF3457601.1 unnamed protein product [Fusarium graminearum]CAF3472102.1 unnamed protein product [Fusarium graminearum]
MLRNIILMLTALGVVVTVSARIATKDDYTNLPEPIMTRLAPLVNSDLAPDNRVKDSYVIYLRPGHSLDDHAKAIKHDLKQHIDHVYSFIEDKVVYVGMAIDKDLLAAIRGDPKVEKVEVQGSASPAPM